LNRCRVCGSVSSNTSGCHCTPTMERAQSGMGRTEPVHHRWSLHDIEQLSESVTHVHGVDGARMCVCGG
jgi:hypothetical protein